MLSLIICAVVAGIIILLGILCAIFTFQDFGLWDAVGTLAAFIVGAGMVGILTGAATTVVGNLASEHHDHYRTVELVALRDGTGQTGQYFLGTGTTDTTGKYVFYYADSDGARRLVNIDAGDIRLYEDSAKPYAIQYTGCELAASWVGDCFDNGPRFVELHVPAGSVRNQVDLALNDK
ncbi:hypothetical protein [Nocardia africana]